MGGCRCTYVGCKRCSDSITHFFHYPVKDEERCTKWLQHAQRLEFKNLTRSQLSNKVICQYHFADNMFMNYRHDRLVPRAVPINSSESNPAETTVKSNETSVVPKAITTDVLPGVKEESTMVVNTSPILGLSFITPDDKRPRYISSYVELLTRQHTVAQKNNSDKTCATTVKRRIKPIISGVPNTPTSAIDTSVVPTGLTNISSDASSNAGIPANTAFLPRRIEKCKVEESVISTANDEITLQDMNIVQPIEINLISPTGDGRVTSSTSTIISDLFKTPPKSMQTVSESRCESDVAKRKIISNNLSVCPAEKRNKFHISSNESVMIDKPRIASILLNRCIQSTSKDANSPIELNNLEKLKTNVNVINKQLLLYNKQNNTIEKSKVKVANTIKTAPVLIEKISEKIVEIPTVTEKCPSVKKTVQNVPKIDSLASKDIPINEYVKLIHENSKEIAELKRMLLAQKIEKQVVVKSKFKRKLKRISKSYLFTQIVPYLSPELAKMVHKEMFPMLVRH